MQSVIDLLEAGFINSSQLSDEMLLKCCDFLENRRESDYSLYTYLGYEITDRCSAKKELRDEVE